jgi:putative protein-disulfide isomerase
MTRLYYIHDPMCSWCWAFRPALTALKAALPPGIEFRQLLGGLAADTNQPMPEEMQHQLQATWRRIQEKLPETRFNFDFWRDNQPRRTTYPACRAVVAARRLEPDSEEAMILAIQEAYYLQAQNPSDDVVLTRLAEGIGLADAAFARLLNDTETHSALQREIELASSMGARSFPSLVLQQGTGYWPVAVDYLSIDPMLQTLDLLLE